MNKGEWEEDGRWIGGGWRGSGKRIEENGRMEEE